MQCPGLTQETPREAGHVVCHDDTHIFVHSCCIICFILLYLCVASLYNKYMKLLLHLNVFQSLFNYTTTLISYLSTAKLMQGNPTLTTKPYTGYQPRHWLQVLTLGPYTGDRKFEESSMEMSYSELY